MGALRLLTTVGLAARSVVGANNSADARPKPPKSGLRTTFETFVASYVPASSAPAMMSMFARWTTAGRIDLSRTKSLSDLLHQMHQNLQVHQATQDKRYYGLMKTFREGVKAWEKQEALEVRTRFRVADELKLSDRARERRMQEQVG